MHVLMLGGTGFIGREVLEALLSRADSIGLTHVTLVSRRGTSALVSRIFSQYPELRSRVVFTPLEWDVVESPPERYSRAVDPATHVFYAVQFPGHPVEDPKQGRTYLRYDLGGLEKVLCALGPHKPRRVVYMSGAGAGRGRAEPWFQAKDHAERLLADFSRLSGGSWLALRPSLVYGQSDVSLNRFLDMARRFRVVPLFGHGEVQLEPVWVKDLARAAVELGFCSSLTGAYDFRGPEITTLRNLVARLLAVRGVDAGFVPMPVPLMRLAGEFLGRVPGQILSRGAVDFLTTSVPLEAPSDPLAAAAFEEVRKSCKKPAEAFALY